MSQSTALRVVRDQLARFATGQITSDQLHAEIAKDLTELCKNDGGESLALTAQVDPQAV
jgi:hypothetical protein